MTCIDQDFRDKAKCISAQSVEMTTGPSSKPLEGLRIGIPTQTHLPSPSIQLPESLLKYLKSLGASLQAVDLPSFNYALPAYYVLASAEASSNLARYGGGWFGSRSEKDLVWEEGESGEDRRRRIRTEGFGQEVKKRILAGTHALSAKYAISSLFPEAQLTSSEFNNTYLKALHLRHLLRDELSRTFRIQNPLSNCKARPEGIDLLLHPTAVQTAPLLSAANGKSEYQQDLLTVPASLAGLPALSVPAGTSDGLPIGMSLMGQWGMESLVFAVGRHIENWQGESHD
jgi:aspartyl-tRNA(Asn)/glutamyl-tRNA(Gln) amidotransferase subunit A